MTDIKGATRFENLAPTQRHERSALAPVGAGSALLLLLVGLPVVLWLLAGPPPIPTELPSLRSLAEELSIEDIVTILVGVVWVAWLLFAISVVLEVIAARRGGLARHVPGSGPIQRLASFLVGAMLLTGVAAGPVQALVDASEPAPVAMSQVDKLEVVSDAAEAGTAAEASGSKVYIVKAPDQGYHDNLWDISERHLGDGRRYHEIFELNKDRVQKDGQQIQLARLIQPGWELVMPDDAVGIEPISDAPVNTPAEEAPTQVDDAGLADSDIVSTQNEAVGDLARGAGLMAAAIIGALVLARRSRLGRAPAADSLELEASLRITASPDRVAKLDAALRDLTDRCRDNRIAPPPIYGARLSDDSLELLLNAVAADAPDGWSVSEDGLTWQRDVADLKPADGGAVLFPALVSLGIDVDGSDILLDLEAAGGVISVSGDPYTAGQVVSSLVVQAATAPWSEDLLIGAAGLPDGLPEIGEGRLVEVTDLAARLDVIEQHVAALPKDVLTGRTGRRVPAPAHLLAMASAPTGDDAARIGRIAGGGARSLSVVVAGDHPDARWQLIVDDHGSLRVPQLDLAVTANRLAASQVDRVAELFTATWESDDDGRPDLPPGGRAVDAAAWATAGRRIAVLGTVEVQGADDIPRIDQVTEIVAFLALHPEGVHPTVLGGAVWPRGVTDDVRDAAIDRARTWLGTDVDGTHLLRADSGGLLSLADAAVCDWDVVRHLLRQARGAKQRRDEVDALMRALELVRGEPFTALPAGRFAWVARADLPRTIVRVIVDAAARLIEIIGDDDPDGAARACERGLIAAPGNQSLWRDLLRLRHRVDGAAGVRRTLDVMATELRDIPLEAETEALIDELLPPEPQEAHA